MGRTAQPANREQTGRTCGTVRFPVWQGSKKNEVSRGGTADHIRYAGFVVLIAIRSKTQYPLRLNI